MAEGPVVVAVAQADADAVDGVAVGEPVERQPSGSSMDPNSPAVSPAVSSQVSDGYLYSALYAKCFASFDTDKNGTIDRSELRAALNILGLESVDVDECMAGFPNAAEGIALKDWRRDWTTGYARRSMPNLRAEVWTTGECALNSRLAGPLRNSAVQLHYPVRTRRAFSCMCTQGSDPIFPERACMLDNATSGLMC